MADPARPRTDKDHIFVFYLSASRDDPMAVTEAIRIVAQPASDLNMTFADPA